MAQTKRLTRAQKELLVEIDQTRNPKSADRKALSSLIEGGYIRRTIDGYSITAYGRPFAQLAKEAASKAAAKGSRK